MAKRKSENFLPQTFRTLSNRRFLNATIDPLIQEPSLKKMFGYIGQQDQSPVFNKDDYYINENDSYSQFYQLEPGVVIKKRQYGTNTYKVDNVYNYVDLLNQIAADGGINNNHDRLFSNRYYSYNGFIDLDKLTNYRQYYWVPGGPLTVDVTAANTPTQQNFYIHRNSYVANNQTELQSAALGATGYSVDGYTNVINPTLTLVRGGSYTFNVNQDTEFWIQTEIGVNGLSSVQNNISTRDVLGVTNNGTKSGTVTFTVPLSTAQDYLVNYTTLSQTVDLVVDDITYEQLQGQNYDSFILEYGLDGVRAFDGKYIVLTSTTGWGTVSSTQWGGVWRLNVGNDPTAADYRLMNLTYMADWPELNKVFVTQGDVYGHLYAYKDMFGVVKKFPTLSAAQSVLYYVDATNPLVYGTIQLVDPEPNSLLNVNDIIGRKNYTSPNGINFTSGLKVKFTGVIVPAEYQGNEYIVEGVGSSIKLIKYADLVTPETINTNLGSSFGNSRGYDADGTGYDGTTNSPEQKDYVTINRASIDGNSWSRNNRWFHRDVLQAAADYNNVSYAFDSNQQAKRPIVEFLPNLKLFNYGTNYAGSVTCIDSVTTSAFAQVEGFNSYAVKTNGVYNSDGIQLLNGLSVIFTQETDPVKRATLYRVQNNKTRTSATYNKLTFAFTNSGSNYLYINDIANLAIGQHVTGTGIPNYTTITSIDTVFDRVYISNNITQDISSGATITFDNSYDQIHLVPIKTFSNGDTVVAMEGVANQGNMFYYLDGEWVTAQIRNSRPQFPLFDVIDQNGYSFGNQTVYPSSDFSGSKLFGYAVGTGSRDSELGFPLVYKSIGNLGDIVFENYYQNESFNYSLNQVDQAKSINRGFGAIIVGWDNYTLANGWYRVSDKSKQYITKVFTASTVSVNNFDLQVVYDNSYYENNIFVYVNGVLQSQTNYTLKTNSITSVIVFASDLAVGDRVFVKIYGTSAQYKETYTMPRNLTNNSENTEFTTITLGQVRNHLIEIGDNLLDLVGEPAGANNFRDLNYNYVGGKLLQHSASMRPAALLFANRDVDPMQFIRYAADSYNTFKNQLLNYITNTEFPNPTNYRDSLDMVLEEFSKVANIGQPFYYTDMVGFGTDYIKNSYTVANTTYRSFNLTQDFADDTKGYRSLLVYLNGVLLLKNVDYTIGTRTITINNNVTIVRNDKIEIYEYNNTQGCNIPATPTKLGMYPKFKPEIFTDDTYVTPTLGVIGHDGSFTKGWGDYRDNILLEFEKRVYNNITTTYSEDSDVDLSSVVPSAFRVTDYTIDEWTQLLAPQYLRWAHINNVDIFTNNTITGDEFTFNYATGTDKLFGQPVPGYWRGIYKYFYDTDHPHTKPWEMLGFTQKPSWWQLRYGPAPYTSENGVLWSDLEAGYVYNGNPTSAYYNSRYARPGLTSIIPVDEHGNLLNPNQCVLRNYDANYSAQNWVVGDQSPAETAWRRSVDYPFAVMMAWCLAKPAEWTALKYNTRDLAYNTLLNQFINKTNNNRQFDLTATGPSDFIPGYNVWLRDYLTNNNLDITENWINVANNSTFNLVYKMGSYTDKSYLTIVADQVSPQSTNSSVIIPQENYQVKVTKSAPVARAVYSAVIVQKVINGYQVSGFDRERPYFLTIPSRVSNNNYSIAVGNERAIVYQDSTDNVFSYPYGSIFNTKQQVVDFLVSYGRYLESQGFVFEQFLSDNTTKSDWVLAAKEFLFWNQQQWGNDTIISLTPAGTDVKFVSTFGVVDTLSNTNNYTKVVNSDNVTLTGSDYRVYRDDNLFQLELKNAQKGVHLVDLAIIQYEHTLILDNNTVFNDILYDEQVGSRQFRLRLDGAKTNDWNGSLYAPGFFVNVSDVPQWVAYTDYYKGDIVLFKSQYYAAQDFIPGTAQFVSSNWYPINGDLLSKNLIPNMASGAAQFLNFHDPDTTDLNSAADLLSKSETGFSPRQYFADLGLDNTSQYKFYLGMVSQKGTKAVLNAYLRNKQKRIDSDIKLVEQWAIKLDNYGGTNQNDKLEFNIGNATTVNNQYLFELVNQTDARNQEINSIKPSDLLYKPYTYITDIFAKTQNNKTVIPTAGPVNPNDVDATVFDINKIYNISALSSILSEGSKVWIAADSANQWGVYRLSQPGNVFVTYINQINPTELQFTTNLPHNLSQYDYVMLKNGRLAAPTTGGAITDMSGFYRVSKVTNTTFSVKITDNTTVGTGALNAILYKLVNVRYSTVNNFTNFVPVRGWNMGEIVYIDAGVDGYNVLQNSNSWVYTQTKSPVFTSPTDNFGSSIKINSTQGFVVVGSSAKSGTGSAFVYGKREDGSFQEIGILAPDNRITTFGANVDINDSNFAFVSAPNAFKGIVYTANVNSQEVQLTQAIHYDNLYAITAGFSQSNNSILLDTVFTFDSTANIAEQASYSLDNFKVGMEVAGLGINAGTVITSISSKALTKTIVMNKNANVYSSDTATILQANSSIFKVLYANITSANANIYISNSQSITGVLTNSMPILGNGIPAGTYITAISNISGYNVFTLSSNVTTANNSLLTIVQANANVVATVSSVTNTANTYFIISGATSLSGVSNGQPFIGANISNGTVIANTIVGAAYNILGVSSNVNIGAYLKLAIYPNVQPTSNFGYSISASGNGEWLYVGEPTTNSVYVYKYKHVYANSSLREGDGTQTSFTYPSGATGSANDIKVYVDGVLKIPNYDYIKAPGQDIIAFDTAPVANAAINLVYEDHYVEVNRIVTDDPDALGFGTSVSTNYDGSTVVIGAANSSVNSTTTLAYSGKTYVYDRTAEIFVANGATTTFQLSNALSNLTTITTPTLITNPSVTVDGANTNATFNTTTNQVSFANAPARGSIVRVETNQFVNTLISYTDLSQEYSYYGTAVKLDSTGSIAFSGAPGYATSSSQNGAVFRLINIPKLYGNVVGSKTGFSIAANSTIRINDYLVKFGETLRPPYAPIYYSSNVDQVVSTINAAGIPYITAGKIPNGAIYISSTDTSASPRISLRNEGSDILGTLGITQWNMVQKLTNPIAQDTARFGEILAISPDANSMVVGSTLSNTKTTVTFDSKTTTYDRKGTRFRDVVYQSGAAHLYEYQTAANESATTYGSYAYATLIQDQFANSYDRYSSGVDIGNNFLMVGAPHAHLLGNPVGAMYIYYNQNAAPVWQTIRSGGVDYDSRNINRVYLYNSTTARLIAELPVIDLPYAYLPNSSESYLDYVINYDPAVYNVAPTTISFSYDRKNAWGREQVGKLWWDINSIKYYDNTQGDNLERFNYWGLAFPGSTVNVYEWIESDVLPKNYIGSSVNNTPLYTINDVYSSQVTVDEKTGQAVTKYYFWVKNSILANTKRPSAREIQTALISPRNNSEPFAAVINKNAIGIFNAQNLVSIDTNLAIEYKNTLEPQLVHSEWTMFDDGTDLGVATEFLNKLNDSLTGQDISGRIIPDFNLPIGQKYGMSVDLRQSLFKDNYYARQLFIEKINEICIKYPMVLTRNNAINQLNNIDPVPLSSEYTEVVNNITELGYLNTAAYPIGTQVLVLSDSNSYNNGWSLFTLVFNSTSFARRWEYVRVQTYNTNDYWTYADWYSTKYNAQAPINHTVTTENDIANLTLNVNDLIYVTNSNSGGWKLVLVNATDLELVAQQNATIQFKSNLYNLAAASQGFQTSSFQSVGFDTDSNLEFNTIFDIIRDYLLINEYRNEYKEAIALLIDIVANQHQQTDWMMKTSLVDLYHRVRGLDQLPVYLPQPENTVTEFFNEVKPFHTKLKQYIARYDNSNDIDKAYASITDFDLQPYKNTIVNSYRSPQLGNSLDVDTLSNTAVYQPWVNNHKYGITLVTLVDGGAGYDGSTTAVVVGDGTGAIVKPYILNGSVYTIEVINAGQNYTYAEVQIYGIGTGARAEAVLGLSLTRNFNTNIKFDRNQYFNNIQDWTANTSYAINDVIVYNATPYRCITAHTSGATFDATKFLVLIVKVWYPKTTYNINDIVVYNNTSYVVTTAFTSALTFDSTNMSSYNGLWLDNACDRVWAYYAPLSGMAGRDLAQVMTGIYYPGNGVIGPGFNQVPGYDVNYYDYIPYDYSTKDIENVYDIYGVQSEDSIIRSLFTDTGLGLRPEDIDVVGGGFIDTYSSHAPEELIPGQLTDTLDIKVNTLPITDGGPDIKIFTSNYIGSDTFSYDPEITGVELPLGGIEKFYVIDRNLGPIAETYHFTVDYYAKTITVLYTPSSGTFFYVLMIGSNGVNPVTDLDYYADGTQTDFDIPDFVTTDVQQAYVKVNGVKVSNWSLVNTLENGRTLLAVRFDTAPAANDYVQVHLYAVALGTKAYSEWHEQTFVISSASYPTNYNFTLDNEEIYVEPVSSFPIVRLNGSDLLPPQQSYYFGDGVTTNFSMTDSWIETYASIVDPEIIVVVDGVTQVRGQDYTVDHGSYTAMPVIQFTTAPQSGARIVISDSSQCDFKIYGNQIWISPSVVITPNSKLTVLTQGNHDPNEQYTKLFSGDTASTSVIDNGLDTTGFDSVGFDNELSNYIGAVYYTLPRAITNINQLYITLKAPNTTGGFPLLPYRDFKLITPTIVVLDTSLNISGTSVITVRIFGEPVRQRTLEFRMFKDMRDNSRIYAVKDKKATLTANLLANANYIYVDNVNYLQTPGTTPNNSGIVIINGERITYGTLDRVNNRLGNLRRGTAGTGTPNLHVKGTLIYDSGSTLEIPNTRESFVQTPVETYISSGLFTTYANSYTNNTIINRTLPLVPVVNNNANTTVTVRVTKNSTTLTANSDYVVSANSVTINSNVNLGTYALANITTSNGNIYISNTYTTVSNAMIGQTIIGGNLFPSTTITNVSNSAPYIVIQISSNQTVNANANLQILDTITVYQGLSNKMLVTANSYIRQGTLIQSFGTSLQDSTSSYAEFIRSQ
jgi:hypothetical protein